MIFTDNTYKYFANMPHKIRAAVAESKSDTPFFYQDEPFFEAYEALDKVWVKRVSQKQVAKSLNIGPDKIKQWELSFSDYGTIGLLPQLSYVKVDPKLEKLVVLIKASRPHQSASLALRLAQALEIPGASLELIRQIQREWECVLSTIRTSIFSNQNCQLSANEDGDLEITFLDGDQLGIIKNMAQMMEKRKKMGINKVSWWGNRAVRIKVKNQYKFCKLT